MPRFTEKSNQNNLHKPISAAALYDFKLRTVGGRLRIAHNHFALVFDLSPQLVGGALLDWMQQDGQRDTVWATEADVSTGVLWADATATLVLVDRFRCQPSVAEALLTELGFYDVRNLGVAA